MKPEYIKSEKRTSEGYYYIMKFEQNPKRCYLCCKAFSQSLKPIPVIGGNHTPGYICPTCYREMFKRDK